MVTGNVYYFFKNEELPGTYYSATIKIRSNSTFYDRLHFILGKLSKEKLNPDGIIRTYHSYHNEDHYIFEVKIISTDSSIIYNEGLKVIADIEKDSIIHTYFNKRLADMQMLKNQNQKAYSKAIVEPNQGVLNEFIITTLMINDINLGMNLLNIQKELQVFPFSNNDVVLVKSPVGLTYLKMNLVFFVIGLFVAIAIREFGQTNNGK